MYPILKIGIFRIPMFATMVWLGLIAFTITIILLLEKKEGAERKTVNRILIVCAAGFTALFVFAFLFNSLFHSIAKGKLVLGGITWLGGLLGAFPTLLLGIHFFCPRIKGHALTYFNLLIPGIALAHGFGRIGCFLGGCCYGSVTDSIFGVCFPAGSNAALLYPAPDGNSLPVYPTQLFEAIFEFLLFTVMLIFYKKLHRHFFETYLFGYGTFRFFLEFLRGDNRGSTGFFLSPSQVISILFIVVGVLLILYHKGKFFKKLHAKMERYRQETALYGIHVKADVLYTLKRLKSLQLDGVLSQEEYENAEKTLQIRIHQKNEISPTDEDENNI